MKIPNCYTSFCAVCINKEVMAAGKVFSAKTLQKIIVLKNQERF